MSSSSLIPNDVAGTTLDSVSYAHSESNPSETLFDPEDPLTLSGSESSIDYNEMPGE